MTENLTGLEPQDLHFLLSGLPSEVGARQSEYNLNLVRRLGEAPCITGLLRRYLNDEKVLAEVASRSYRHVNHFDKIVLVDTENQLGYRLTLHAWRPPYSEKEINDELIHDHRFSFWSTILTGHLVSQNFSRGGEGIERAGSRLPFRQYQYSPEKEGVATTSNFYEFKGEAELEALGETKESPGNAYHLKYHRIHRVVLPRDGMTCTLVLRGPRERNFSNVYNTAYPTTDTQSGNVMFTRLELAHKLSTILASINGDTLRA